MFKPVLLILLFSFYASLLHAQHKNFILTGQVNGLKNGIAEIFIANFSNGRSYKSFKSPVKNGQFKLSGSLSEPSEAFLVFNDTIISCGFYIDPAVQSTVVTLSEIKKQVVIEGSKTNAEYLNQYLPWMKQYEEAADNWYNALWELEKNYGQFLPTVIKDSMDAVFNNIRLQKDTALADYNKKFMGSAVGAWSLCNRIYNRGYKEIFERILYAIPPRFKNSKIFEAAKKMLTNSRKLISGAPFPYITVADSSGRKKNTQNIISAGSITLIDFWFSGCHPCISQFPELKRIFAAYRQKGFTIIGVSVDKEFKAWKDATNFHGIAWPQYIDKDKIAAKKLLIHAYPANFLIDQAGKIIAKDLDPSEIEKYLEENLR